MSNILFREIAWTFRWLRTYIPWRIERKGPIFTRILRRGFRVQMRKNRVLTAVWASIGTLAGRVARWPF